MTFALSKIFWVFAAPGNLLALVLAIGTLWLAASGRRRGFGLVAFAAVGFLAIAVLPLGEWLLLPLENRFPSSVRWPDRVDGIVVVGGAVDEVATAARGQAVFSDGGARLTAFLALARHYPSARLVLSGGEARFAPRGFAEAQAMRLFLIDQGLDPARLTLETESRNTYENAALSYRLVRPQPSETWMLVTSAAHVPRAVGCFRRIGWRVLPHPVDYKTAGRFSVASDLSLDRDLVLLTHAMKEWIGLVAYRILGRTDALFPGPA